MNMQPKEYIKNLVEAINNYPDKKGHMEIYNGLQRELITVAGAFMRCGLITTQEQIEYYKRANIA